MMKKHILLVLLFFVSWFCMGQNQQTGTFFSASSQEPITISLPDKTVKTRRQIIADEYAGVVTTTVNQLEEIGEELVMELDIHIGQEAINRRQSWRIIPELVSPSDSSLTFAGVLLNGKIKEKLFRRKMKFRNQQLLSDLSAMKVEVTQHTDKLLTYKLYMPYEFWMDNAQLKIHQVLASPANKEQLFTVDNAATVKLQPRIAYQVQPLVNFIEIEKEKKDWNMQGLARLDFPVSQSVLRPEFRRNPQELAKIDSIVTTILEDKDLTLQGIYLHGFASPEGGYQLNDHLSRARAEALKNYLKNKFSIRETLFHISNTPEDWNGLKEIVERSVLADKSQIIQIIETVENLDQRKNQLKRVNNGVPYRTMINDIYPELRRTEYRAEFNVRNYSVEEAMEVINRKPQNLSLYELYMLTQHYDQGSKEMDRTYEIMLRQYPDHPLATINYAGYLLTQNDLYGAKRQLDKFADNPLTYNNLGVFYLLTNELDKAEEYFQKALENDIPEARQNMEEIAKKRADNKIMERYKNR